VGGEEETGECPLYRMERNGGESGAMIQGHMMGATRVVVFSLGHKTPRVSFSVVRSFFVRYLGPFPFRLVTSQRRKIKYCTHALSNNAPSRYVDVGCMSSRLTERQVHEEVHEE
jgi:hypothetical protein